MSIYDNINDIHDKWGSIKSIIKIERFFERKGEKTEEISYYITSKSADNKASEYNKIIRGHWLIENSLHYTKDTTFQEDACKIVSGFAPENLSVLRNIVINIFRKNGFKNLAQAIRLHTNDIWKMHEAILT